MDYYALKALANTLRDEMPKSPVVIGDHTHMIRDETEIAPAFRKGADDGHADWEHIDIEAGFLSALTKLGRDQVKGLFDAIEGEG